MEDRWQRYSINKYFISGLQPLSGILLIPKVAFNLWMPSVYRSLLFRLPNFPLFSNSNRRRILYFIFLCPSDTLGILPLADNSTKKTAVFLYLPNTLSFLLNNFLIFEWRKLISNQSIIRVLPLESILFLLQIKLRKLDYIFEVYYFLQELNQFSYS